MTANLKSSLGTNKISESVFGSLYEMFSFRLIYSLSFICSINPTLSIIVLLRSAANVLRGERVVYAFPDVRPNVAITIEGEVLAKTALASQETNPESVRNRINLLLASTLSEVRRRGSLTQGLQFDANAVNTLARELTKRSGGRVELEAVALLRSETADPVAIELRPSRKLLSPSAQQDEIP